MDANRGRQRADAPTDAHSRLLGELLARTALADRRAFERLYRDTAGHLFGLVLRIVEEKAAAEDVIQEVFVEVWSKAGSYRADLASPMTWLRVLAQRRAIDYRRRRKASGALRTDPDADPDGLQGPGESPEAAGEGGLWNRYLNDCLDQLPRHQREVVLLLYVHGWTQQELVDRQSRPLGTVKSWARRGLEFLRDCVERIGGR